MLGLGCFFMDGWFGRQGSAAPEVLVLRETVGRNDGLSNAGQSPTTVGKMPGSL